MVIVKTPLRISFVGGGSDMKDFYKKRNGGVVCTAIDKSVYAIVKERFDDMIYINYSQKECVEDRALIQHDLVREAMKIAHALYAYQNELVTAEQLAMDACRIEIDVLGKPIGRQDQYAAAYGGVNKFIFSSGDKTERIPVAMDRTARRKFSSSLLLYYTGITRKADNILSRQKKNLLDENKFEAMIKMVDLVDPFTEAMKKNDIKTCGDLLLKNWELKKNMANGISNNEINDMCQKAGNAGALAWKIAGAGGGGFLLLVVPRENQNSVFEALKGFRELPFMMEENGSKIIFDDRSYSSK